MNKPKFKFPFGSLVAKRKGDYMFFGTIISQFIKQSGAVRYVVENRAGILHIFNEGQLSSWNGEEEIERDE